MCTYMSQLGPIMTTFRHLSSGFFQEFCQISFFKTPTSVFLYFTKDLFEKDGPNLSDFIFQNTHFLRTTYYLHIHFLKKSYPGFLCRVKGGIENPRRFQTQATLLHKNPKPSLRVFCYVREWPVFGSHPTQDRTKYVKALYSLKGPVYVTCLQCTRIKIGQVLKTLGNDRY